MTTIRATYDAAANAAYLYLQDPLVPAISHRTYPCDPIKVGGMINLDFDTEGRLIGIEILGARSKLTQYILESAERLD